MLARRGPISRIAPSLFTLAVFGLGCRTAVPPLHPDNPPGAWYAVHPGETLAQIAQRTGTPLDDILELNGIARGQTVEPGHLIYILDSRRATATTGGGAVGLPEPAARPIDLRWPLAAPRVTSGFGVRGAHPHEGVDLGAAEGTPVLAAATGEVVYAAGGIRGYGNMVVLQHGSGLLTVYAHNSKLLVKVGDRVAGGQTIALVGQTGRATAPHLHFEVRDKEIPRDPLRYLPPPPPGSP